MPSKKLNTVATIKPTSNSSGGAIPPDPSEEMADWWGVILSTEPGAQYDDCFARQNLAGIFYYVMNVTGPKVKAQIEAQLDSGKSVNFCGAFLRSMPDANGSQIHVE